ncbi:MAG: hypothetical protein ACRDXX_19485 [Stackebrandtia sp.]
MDSTQTKLRQAIRQAIAKYRTREISLKELVDELDPIVDNLQPEETWEQVSELYTELDAFYGLLATGEEVGRHGSDFPLSPDQQGNVDRIVNEIDRLLN